ncbi:MAG: hypothetical protein ACTTHU_08740, partial [Treponema sp.]
MKFKFSKTLHFPTFSCTNRIESFEISIVCAQVRLRLRAASREKLDCGEANVTLPKAQYDLSLLSKSLHSSYHFVAEKIFLAIYKNGV